MIGQPCQRLLQADRQHSVQSVAPPDACVRRADVPDRPIVDVSIIAVEIQRLGEQSGGTESGKWNSCSRIPLELL